MNKYQFTNTWFADTAQRTWEELVPTVNPTKILEIGSYEGASACFLIDKLSRHSSLEIHCIDTWEGGVEHQDGGFVAADMSAVEVRFHHNIALACRTARNKVTLISHKGRSDFFLSKLLAEGRNNYFDFIYVDGSHQAPDVLCDAVIAFRLLRAGGIIAFDDYLWSEALPYGVDPIRCPKPAIDSFTNLYCRKVKILSAPLYQLFVQKIAD